jgi:hypothetical protein
MMAMNVFMISSPDVVDSPCEGFGSSIFTSGLLDKPSLEVEALVAMPLPPPFAGPAASDRVGAMYRRSERLTQPVRKLLRKLFRRRGAWKET